MRGLTLPQAPKPKRAQRSVTLPPALDAILQTEADARLLNPSLLVERALTMYLPLLPSMDEPAAP